MLRNRYTQSTQVTEFHNTTVPDELVPTNIPVTCIHYITLTPLSISNGQSGMCSTEIEE